VILHADSMIAGPRFRVPATIECARAGARVHSAAGMTPITSHAFQVSLFESWEASRPGYALVRSADRGLLQDPVYAVRDRHVEASR
jgi:hypothetical protein